MHFWRSIVVFRSKMRGSERYLRLKMVDFGRFWSIFDLKMTIPKNDPLSFPIIFHQKVACFKMFWAHDRLLMVLILTQNADFGLFGGRYLVKYELFAEGLNHFRTHSGCKTKMVWVFLSVFECN